MFSVAVDDRLGVTSGAEYIARRCELFAKLLKVINFPVEYDDGPLVSAEHGLVCR